MTRPLIPFLLTLVLAALLCAGGCSSTPKTAGEADEARAEVRSMASETLGKLNALQPGARNTVQSAYGYAVFSNFGMKILVAGGGHGEGVAVRNTPRSETFMKMAEIQAGLGMGVKKFRLVWVFSSAAAFDGFVNQGWEFGGQATAQAQAADKGGGYAGAVQVAPGIYLYQITDDGLALELTVKGTKYFKDDGLN